MTNNPSASCNSKDDEGVLGVGIGGKTGSANLPTGAILGDSPAVANLRINQRQLDRDGCEVGVSRQALDEAIAEIDYLKTRIVGI